ncbi:MAG TPA: glycosyltransferase family 39 protein [Thermoleophilaceae bacterium]|nr:glycosyltransferase family 39 protein [Thermoleophilaceae bacterium]
MRRGARAAASPAYLALLLLLVAGLVLRVKNNSYGLPFVYNVDEGSHFTARAVAMLGGDWNPHYFQNPSAFTYLANFALRLRFGQAAIDYFKRDPTSIYETTRTVAALLSMVGVVAVFWAGRRLWDNWTAVAAAALLTFGFLPVTYSRIAVTDVGVLAPVALSIVGSVLAWEDGRLRWWVLAGAAAGVAVGFKYTAGLVLLPLAVAAVASLVRGGRASFRKVALGAVAAGLAALLAFFVTNPYFFFEFSDAHRQLSAQATTAGDFGKVGQNTTGLPYYLGTLTWGIGWVGAVAALAGAVLELRREVVRGLILIVFPVVLIAYLSLQARFFSRWLLPAYPVLVLLAGAAIAQAAAAIGRLAPRWRWAVPAAAGLLLVIAVVQGFAADWRSMRVLGREDTRQTARTWLVDHYPRSLRVVIEPAVPARYYRRQGRGGLRGQKAFVRGFAKHQAETRIQYPALLKPDYIDAYRQTGFCLVMTMSLIEGRTRNAKLPQALAYYDELAKQSKVVYHVSPYKPGAAPPRFDFDFSYNYYPSAFRRPGPEITIYRLRNCKQKYGKLQKNEPLPGGIS